MRNIQKEHEDSGQLQTQISQTPLGFVGFWLQSWVYSISWGWGAFGFVSAIFPYFLGAVPRWIPSLSNSAIYLWIQNHQLAAPGLSLPFAALIYSVYAPYHLYRDTHLELSRIKRRLQPQLTLSCGPNFANCREQNVWQDGELYEWHSARVEALSDCEIEDVGAVLKRIASGGMVLWDGPPHELPFGPCGSPDSFRKTIRAKVPYLLNIARITDGGTGGVEIGDPNRGWPFLTSLHEIFHSPGDYLLFITLTGKHIMSQDFTLMLRYRSADERTSLSLVERGGIGFSEQISSDLLHDVPPAARRAAVQ
jgi:hypothetical protein